MTNDLSRRLAQHNEGKNPSTKRHAPFKLVYQEKVADRQTARAREIFLKSGVGRKFLDSLGL